MIRSWLRSTLVGGAHAPTEVDAQEEQKCPGIARALKRILSNDDRPEVLDLGQFSRSAAVYLAHRGARVSVEDFAPPPPTPERAKGEKPSPLPPISIPQPDRKFDLVLAWEHGDFVGPDRLMEFGSELRRVMIPGGWLVLFAQDDPRGKEVRPDRPGCYRLAADDRVVRSESGGPARPRWIHTNRALERALSPLSVQSIKLQRNRIREFLIQKPKSD